MTYYNDIFRRFCYLWHIFSNRGGFDAKKKSLFNCAVWGRACRTGKDCPEGKKSDNLVNVPQRRRRVWVLSSIAAVILGIGAVSYLISSESLRRYMENRINGHLKGYTVHIGKAYFHPLAFSLDLDNLILVQDANPNPPIANINRLHASVQWREVLTGHLVGDLSFKRPKFYVNLIHVSKEEESKVPLKQKGWQEALASIYPLKINTLTIHDGEVTYVDKGPYKPLDMDKINFRASNIRNIRYPDNVYPSAIHLEGRIFEKGRLAVDGYANFLGKPHPWAKADLDLNDMDLSYFNPIMTRHNVSIRRGTLSTKGVLEYNPHIAVVNLKNLDINGADVDYLHLPQTVAAEKKRVRQVVRTAKELSNEPASKIRIDVLRIKASNFGYVNRTTQPNYRLSIDQMEANLRNFSNQITEGPATFELKGKFMGTGNTKVTGTFRPETKNPDFNVNVAIQNTQMPAMSDLFRAYGNFDIKSGLFSFYSELSIKDNKVNGYIKPIFKDMKVYDRRSRQEKSLSHTLYVWMVGGISRLLENRTRNEVATKAAVSGTLESPGTSTWEIFINLLRNAFIKSILPGLDKALSQPKK